MRISDWSSDVCSSDLSSPPTKTGSTHQLDTIGASTPSRPAICTGPSRFLTRRCTIFFTVGCCPVGVRVRPPRPIPHALRAELHVATRPLRGRGIGHPELGGRGRERPSLVHDLASKTTSLARRQRTITVRHGNLLDQKSAH